MLCSATPRRHAVTTTMTPKDISALFTPLNECRLTLCATHRGSKSRAHGGAPATSCTHHTAAHGGAPATSCTHHTVAQRCACHQLHTPHCSTRRCACHQLHTPHCSTQWCACHQLHTPHCSTQWCACHQLRTPHCSTQWCACHQLHTPHCSTPCIQFTYVSTRSIFCNFSKTSRLTCLLQLIPRTNVQKDATRPAHRHCVNTAIQTRTAAAGAGHDGVWLAECKYSSTHSGEWTASRPGHLIPDKH